MYVYIECRVTYPPMRSTAVPPPNRNPKRNPNSNPNVSVIGINHQNLMVSVAHVSPFHRIL